MSKAVALALVFVASLAVGPLAGGVLAGGTPADRAHAGTVAASTGAVPTDAVSTDAVSADAQTTNRMSTDATSTDAATPTIEKSVRLHLTPSEAGRIDVTVTYDVPEELTSLRVQLPERATDVTSESFTETNNGYEWDGNTDPAALRFSVAVNRSGNAVRSSGPQGTYSFVDAGSWALVTVPQLGTEWGWRNARDVTLAENVTVDGEGSTGGEIAYLGPVETHARTANGQTFTLVVPERASMAEAPADVLAALTAASDQLRVGERDSNVWVVAAPGDSRWVARGVEYGGSDFWVVADAPLDNPGNVWFHEYVHTRQAYTATSSGQWTVEAVADYYAALLALEQNRIGFDSFSDYLGRGADDPWADAVLARPETWTYGANYVKGSLVWGELDRRVRLATNSSHSMTDVLWRLNQQDDAVSNDDVLAAIADVSSERVANTGERYTETRTEVDVWSRFEHRRAFSTEPAQMEYGVAGYRVTGPFRNESFETLPALYVGETLAVDANVANTGGADGEYAVTLALGGDVLAVANGSLRPSESTAVSLDHEFAETGTYNLSLGRGSTGAAVDQPPEPRVSAVSVSSDSGNSSDEVTVTATLSSTADAPAAGPVDVTLDGETVASLDAALAAGESVTRSVTISVPESEGYTIAVGNQTARTSGGASQASGTSVPGFGVGLAAVAVVAAVLVSVAASTLAAGVLGGGRER